MNFNYSTLKDLTDKIYEKKKDKLYYKYNQLTSQNPFVTFLKTDINIKDYNSLNTYIQKLLDSNLDAFDFSNNSNLKAPLFIKLFNANISNKEIDKVIKIISKNDISEKKNKKSVVIKFEELKQKFKDLEDKVKNFIGEDSLLKNTLTNEGYAVIVDNILCGSRKYIKLLSDALNNFTIIKDLRQNLEMLNDKERIILEFAYSIAKNEDQIREVISKLLPIRNYHEIVKAEEKEDRKLSIILDYENTKQRIINLKTELMDVNKDIAYHSFNDIYTNFYSNKKDNKDYLYVINKQENMWNIRKTMEYFSEYLLRLFPCWMMSPENVSSVMPLKQDLFDVIIFDEASQIFIENSIPTIYRGKNIAIAGDRKQLKPTTTFMKRYIGNENFEELSLSEQAALEVESLLDLATSRYTNANLTYHYRSKYEELINFSNYAFYDEKLQIAPNIQKDVSKPIERIKVNGIWQDRRNHEEAVEVVKTLKKIFQTRDNNQTIGIITFNTEQEHYIADIIDVECQKDPTFRELYLKEVSRKENGEDTGLFIKNIENVQGEERDIIIFSIGYAKNERGKVVALFGPLSQEGGENRLNVAITRAKEKIYLITSIEPEELNVTYSKHLGPKILKKYLQYARAVSFGNKYEQKIILESLRKKTVIEEKECDGIEQEIKKALEKKKYIVDVNLGSAKYKINLAIFNKKLKRYVLGIEIDSTAYTTSENLLERDIYRNKFLNSRGWNMMRLWSRDWWTDKEKTIELIENKINKAIAKIQSEKANNKKVSKKENNLPENKLLSGNIHEKVQKESQVINTRLNKKVLARLEEDKLNEENKSEEIRKINEVADYNLVLEPIIAEDTKTSKKKKVKVPETIIDESTKDESIIEERTTDNRKKKTKLQKDINSKYIDEIEAKYQGKKDKIAEKKLRKADKIALKKEKKEEKIANKKQKLEEQQLAREENKRIKEEKQLAKENAKKKKKNKKQISKAKSQLSSLQKLKSINDNKKQSKLKNNKIENSNKKDLTISESSKDNKENKSININLESLKKIREEKKNKDTLAKLISLKNKDSKSKKDK